MTALPGCVTIVTVPGVPSPGTFFCGGQRIAGVTVAV